MPKAHLTPKAILFSPKARRTLLLRPVSSLWPVSHSAERTSLKFQIPSSNFQSSHLGLSEQFCFIWLLWFVCWIQVSNQAPIFSFFTMGVYSLTFEALCRRTEQTAGMFLHDNGIETCIVGTALAWGWSICNISPQSGWWFHNLPSELLHPSSLTNLKCLCIQTSSQCLRILLTLGRIHPPCTSTSVCSKFFQQTVMTWWGWFPVPLSHHSSFGILFPH